MEIKKGYQREAKAQWKGKPLTGDIEVSVALFFGTKRRADLDNFGKLLYDSLTGVVYEDDSQISVMHTYRSFDKERPRIEVTIREYDSIGDRA